MPLLLAQIPALGVKPLDSSEEFGRMARATTKARKYSAPKLTIYGDMVKLTASGTSGNPENNPGQTGRQGNLP
jgi:hypothetical protein